MSIYFTSLIPHPTIWGGKTLREFFQLPEDFGNDIGQAWAFSGQPGKSSKIIGGDYNNRTLNDLWKEKPEVFNSHYNTFPFIISLVAPEKDLSIQVHPDTEYAKRFGFPTGKNEAWVFLKSAEGSSIVYGHNAHDRCELLDFIQKKNWAGLVKHLNVCCGETVYIPAGTLHALCSNCVVYEIQQSTDITYRFYDYDRRDQYGNLRPLQVDQAVECLLYTEKYISKPVPQTFSHLGWTETLCISCDSFTVRRIDIAKECMLCFEAYQLMTVISGKGVIQGFPVQKGNNFLLPAKETIHIEGQLSLMATAEQ